jgi:hypothetical protein
MEWVGLVQEYGSGRDSRNGVCDQEWFMGRGVGSSE